MKAVGNIFVAAGLILALVGCSKNNETDGKANSANIDGAGIGVDVVSTNDFESKALITDITTIQNDVNGISFWIFKDVSSSWEALSDNVKLFWETDPGRAKQRWIYYPTQIWEKNTSYTFLAFYPRKTDGSYSRVSGQASIFTNVSSAFTDNGGVKVDQQELLYATNYVHTEESKPGLVSMVLNHVFSKLSFQVKSSFAATVNSVKLYGHYKTATCTLKHSSYEDQRVIFSDYANQVTSSTTEFYFTNLNKPITAGSENWEVLASDLLTVPQTINTDAVTVEINYTYTPVGQSTSKTITATGTLPFDTWVSAGNYLINITLNGSEEYIIVTTETGETYSGSTDINIGTEL